MGSQKSNIVALDDFDTWPPELRISLFEQAQGLLEERVEQRAYDLSHERWRVPAPPRPRTELALVAITDAMQERRIRIFHATRLTNFDEVRREGLRPLSMDERIERAQELACSGPACKLAGQLLRVAP